VTTEASSPLGIAELRSLVAQGDVDTVIVCFPDLQGRPVGKRVTAPFFFESVCGEDPHSAQTDGGMHGIEVCDYLLAVDVDMTPLPGYRFASWETGYGDLLAVPDLQTLRRVPWVASSAHVICDLLDAGGADVEVSPRRVLRRQIERARAAGFEVRCATELEFYLFRDSYEEAARKRWRGLQPDSDTIEDYQLLQTSREEHLLHRIRTEMLAAGIPVEHSKGEAGRGQHEVNVTYGGALETADRHLVFKSGVKEIAALCGRSASFMAKWTMEDSGSSCHLHASLWDAESGAPVMWDPHGTGHLSKIGRHFLAGMLHAARGLTWLWAPYVNSYRRFVPGSWAPTAIVWGEDNRTCGFRVIGSGDSRRIECRIPGADVNPYLALAAMIAAGLSGIESGLELGPEHAGNAYSVAGVPRVPTTLVEAIEELERSEVARLSFGEEVHQHMLNTARQEWASANRVVTDWELARNFERI